MKQGQDPGGARPLHPALHFDEHEGHVGVFDAAGVLWIVSSARRKQRAEAVAEGGRPLLLAPQTYQPLAGRWPEHNLARFLAGNQSPTLGPVLDTIAAVIDHYCELADPRHARLIASWIVASYVFTLFATFPRLHFRGPSGSGKSKLLQLLDRLAFNGLWRISPTPATLFRLIGPFRPTFCLDEMENLDTTDRKEILAIVNSGYKQGGYVDRTEKVGDRFIVMPYEVFAPMAFGSIAALNKVTADRAIRIPTVKGTDPEKVNREVRPILQFANLRGQCYRIALLRFHSIREKYRTQSLPQWLVARHRELWGALLAIAALADVEDAEGVTEDLLALARDEAAERNALPADTQILLTMLRKRLDGASRAIVRPIELAEEAGREHISLSAKQVGLLLDTFGFQKTTRDRFSTRYLITAQQLAGALARDTPWITYTPTPDGVTHEYSAPVPGVDPGVGTKSRIPSTDTRTPADEHEAATSAPAAVADHWPPCVLCGEAVPRAQFRAHLARRHAQDGL